VTDASETSSGEVRIERVIPAPIEEVYEAWTDPEIMAQWLTPIGRAEVRADVRVGGSFRLVMIGDGVRIDHEGEYLTIQPPRLLSFTWRSAYTAGASTVVTVTLEPDGVDTRIALVHERLPHEGAASHRDGWGSILDRLIAALGGDR